MRPSLITSCLALMAAVVFSSSLDAARLPPASAVEAGRYRVDPDHTQIRFGVARFTISPYYGMIGGATGSLTIDPKNVKAASVQIEIPTANLLTTNATLTEQLKSPGWFDAARHPTISFRSTEIIVAGPEAASIRGIMTIKGISKPVSLQMQYFGSGLNATTGKKNVGFVGSAIIKRADFGIDQYLNTISNDVALTINAAFVKED